MHNRLMHKHCRALAYASRWRRRGKRKLNAVHGATIKICLAICEAFRGGQQFAAVRRASLRVSSLAVAPPSGFILRLDAGQCLSVGVAHERDCGAQRRNL
jgi:hypothetical protein